MSFSSLSPLSRALIFLGALLSTSLSIAEGAHSAGLHEALLKQQAMKTEHRQQYPYSKYFKLTLRRDENKQPNGVFVYPGEDVSLFNKAGFKQGDVVLSVDGISATSETAATNLVEKLYMGSSSVLVVENSGLLREVAVDFSTKEFSK